MAKVSELSDKDLEAMIAKHEKTLQLLMREKERRAGRTGSVRVNVPAKPVTAEPERRSSEAYHVVIEDEIMEKAKKEVPQLGPKDPEDETADMRLTRVLKLSKTELEQFNKAVENKGKKIKK